ncbi:hypothetical protein X975_16167, partial [Stegodyphus mimosarum]
MLCCFYIRVRYDVINIYLFCVLNCIYYYYHHNPVL